MNLQAKFYYTPGILSNESFVSFVFNKQKDFLVSFSVYFPFLCYQCVEAFCLHIGRLGQHLGKIQRDKDQLLQK